LIREEQIVWRTPCSPVPVWWLIEKRAVRGIATQDSKEIVAGLAWPDLA
jgi:hypothetical protein